MVCHNTRKHGYVADAKTLTRRLTVTQLLRNRVYIGDMVQGKRAVVSYKVKKRLCKDPEDWIVVEGTHEPLIDRDTWERAQKRLQGKTITRTTARGTLGLFAGIIRCVECGSALAFMRRERKDRFYGVYRCSRYNNSGGTACTTHYLHESHIARIVMDDIQTHARLAVSDREGLIARLLRSAESSRAGSVREIKAKLREIQTRLDTIARMVKSLYEDKVTGKMPDEVFQGLAADYSRERAELEGKRPALYKQLEVADDSERKVTEWVKRVSAQIGIEELDRDTIAELIDSIEVSEGKSEKMEISICYRFVSEFLQKGTEDIA